MATISPPPSAAASRPAALTTIAGDALTGLTPLVVVNRRVDIAQRQVDASSDTPFPTIHGDPRTDAATLARRAVRYVNEHVRGTYGDGDAAGHTTYGSVRFVPTEDVAAGAQAIVGELQRQGSAGVRAYGPVTFVTDPEDIATRTTFAADDTGATLARVRTRDELPTVVAERIERSGGVGDTPLADLLAMPRSAASDAVRGWLLSNAVGTDSSYIEAQVRRLTPSDVLAAVVDLRGTDDVQRRWLIDPGSSPAQADVERLRSSLDRHDVPTFLIEDT